jgi:regulator of protease activity HflC (stomatin/prohibitin superfamily)
MMNMFQKPVSRIRNQKRLILQKDFIFNAFSMVVLGVFLAGGTLLQTFLGIPMDEILILQFIGGGIWSGILLIFLPLWGMMIALVTMTMLGSIGLFSFDYIYITGALGLGIFFAPTIQLVQHWDKVVILRAGKFRKVHGPGIHFLLPIFDRTASFIDTRIRATDFKAEKTLTQDTVPVDVDALCFWMVWDAQKATLEVENFIEAVTLSAQTALRDSIGKNELSALLSEREKLGHEIQRLLDKKTNPWGITILSVEITDIIIPQELEDAMSKQAQAERERRARVILGSAEVEIAKKFEEAAQTYGGNETALQLRAMNMIYEGLRQKGAMIMVPSSILENMNIGGTLGTMAFQKILEQQAGEENKLKD